MSQPRRKPVRLAEAPGPPEALEAAIEARLDEVFLEAVQAKRGKLSPVEVDALRKLIRRRDYRDEDPTDPYLQVYATVMKELAEVEGILTDAENEALEAELQARLPGHAHGYDASTPPLKPTKAPPGSKEKIRVMRTRYLRRQALHHPDDAKNSEHPLFRTTGRTHDEYDE